MKQFIFFNDWFEFLNDLTPEEFKNVITAVARYAEDGKEPESLTRYELLAFKSIKTKLDHDSERYEEARQRRSEAGRKGNEKRWKQAEENRNATELSQCDENIAMRQENRNAINESQKSLTKTKTITKTIDDDDDDDTREPQKKPSFDFDAFQRTDQYEAIRMRYKLTPEQVKAYAATFELHIIAEQSVHENDRDVGRHFYHWVIKQEEIKRRNQNKTATRNGNNQNHRIASVVSDPVTDDSTIKIGT